MKADKPKSPDAALDVAAAAYGAQQFEQAAKAYRRVLNLDPHNATATRMLGNIASRQKKHIEALKWLSLAVKQAPADAFALYELGRAQRAAGDRAGAMASLGQALSGQAADVVLAAQAQRPEDANLLAELGADLAGLGHWEGAAACFAERCRLMPGDAVSQYNRGVALQELGRAPEAIDAFERAIALKSGYAAAYFALALAYRDLGAFDAALVAIDLAVAANAADPRFPLERARVLLSLNNPAQALQTLDALLSQHPGFAEALNVKGVALKSLYRQDEALAAYDQAIRLQPDFADARINRANLYLLKRRFSAALSDYDEVQRVKPDSPGLAGVRLYTSMHLYRWADFEATLPQLVRGVEQGHAATQPLAMACFLDDPEIQQKTSRAWAASVPRPQGHWQRPPGTRRPGQIRIAYVSGDFKSHPVSFLMAEVFELHDRERFEVIALNYGAASNDAMQERLRRSFDQFYDVEQLPDQQLAELARSLDIDIAIDISGFTSGARTTLFAWRLAPVQIMYIGYLGTSGADFYDYVIADPVIVPPEVRRFYDEKVITLPWYQANDRQRPAPAAPASRAALGLPEDGFVFCSFNNPTKLTPGMFDAWVDILQRVPGSVLWVLGEEEIAKDNLRDNARARGMEPSRLVFASRGSRETYLANLAAADLFLDTQPYNAGTTASDALWMGLPVLTQQGRSFAARVAASVLQSAGLPELITQTTGDYVATAVRLAQQPDVLADLRRRMRASRGTCRLFDAPAFTRHLETALARAYGLGEAGSVPVDIDISA